MAICLRGPIEVEARHFSRFMPDMSFFRHTFSVDLAWPWSGNGWGRIDHGQVWSWSGGHGHGQVMVRVELTMVRYGHGQVAMVMDS